jgi:hypothetical protein
MGLIPEDEEMLNDLNMDVMATVFFQNTQYYGKENIVSVFRNGKRKFYEIHPELYRSLMALEKSRLHPAVRFVFSPAARMLRLGATGLNVAFSFAKNPFRDMFTYALFTKNKGLKKANPLSAYKYALKDVTAKPGELMYRYKVMGGELAGMMGYDRAATMKLYDELIKGDLSRVGKTLQVAKHPIDSLRRVFSVTEMIPRSAELYSRYEHYRKTEPAWTEEDCFIQAFNDAQDVTVNFTRSGYTGEAYNEIAAFFNVAIQGPEKAYRAAKENPVGFALKGLAYLTLPTLFLWWENKDKNWYKNLPLPYKYSNYFVELKDDVIVRLPMPFELGTIFSALPLAAIERMYAKDPETVAGLVRILRSQAPPIEPSIMAPWVDIWKNKNYLGQPIESEAMRYEYVTERARDYTTGLSKVLSRGFDALGISLSPVQLDYLINSYTGGFSRQFPLKPVVEPADIPILSSLLVDMPSNPRRQMERFFTEYEMLTQKKKSDIATEEDIYRLIELEPVYGVMNSTLLKMVRISKEQGDMDMVKGQYGVIANLLESVYNREDAE